MRLDVRVAVRDEGRGARPVCDPARVDRGLPVRSWRPELALALRAKYAAVRPGYHQNKRHWNTVELDGSIKDDELREMIDHSYELVVAS